MVSRRVGYIWVYHLIYYPQIETITHFIDIFYVESAFEFTAVHIISRFQGNSGMAPVSFLNPWQHDCTQNLRWQSRTTET